MFVSNALRHAYRWRHNQQPSTVVVFVLFCQYLEEFKEEFVPATSPIYADVLRVAERLVYSNQDFPGMKDHKWTIHVIKDKQRNAFVFPVCYKDLFLLCHMAVNSFKRNENGKLASEETKLVMMYTNNLSYAEPFSLVIIKSLAVSK